MVAERNERSVAERVVAWLRDMQWDVYQEVQVRSSGGRADIVATHGSLVWVVEVKMNLCIRVMEQAYRWKWCAHYVSIAVPPLTPKQRCRTAMVKPFAERILRDYGIGLFIVSTADRAYSFDHPCSTRLGPALHRKADADYLRSSLHEEQKTWTAAGNSHGEYYSPFRATCKQVALHVKHNPGCTLKELIDGINHHYASDTSARSALVQWIRGGVVPGVRSENDGRRIRLYAEEQEHGMDEAHWNKMYGRVENRFSKFIIRVSTLPDPYRRLFISQVVEPSLQKMEEQLEYGKVRLGDAQARRGREHKRK